ncbi:hypothetical protein M0R04_13995 [Candidatus Dojkabacteria bacterium]|jgi:hypothetical protein|nr:hypothetical protein [Candidatus Dojkabacteria bacterium]
MKQVKSKCAIGCGDLCKDLCACRCHAFEVAEEEKCPCGRNIPKSLCSFHPKDSIDNDWAYGGLTFDKIKNILEICNVNNVKIEQDYLTISFAPKNVTGNTWVLLKEKMHQITKK